jgi:signal transduction histidine kinase
MQELRGTIYQLRANVGEDNEFTAVAADYLKRFEERTGIATVWTNDTVRRLPYRVEQELGRIVQEALANVERHSGATQVIVRWEIDDTAARLEVSDDGKGFDPGQVVGDHYGIVGMRERADAIGARMRVVSLPGRGTSVVVEVEAADTPRRHVRRALVLFDGGPEFGADRREFRLLDRDISHFLLTCGTPLPSSTRMRRRNCWFSLQMNSIGSSSGRMR